MPTKDNPWVRRRGDERADASVTWLDRAAARELAFAVARRLAASHPEITGVLGFGSVVRGDAVPGSDLDLVLVLAESDEPFLDRIRRCTPQVTELGVDVLPYTEAELSRMIAEGNPLVTSALSEGEWIVGPPERLAGGA